MSDLTIFAYESSAVRTVIQDGEPWFVATDIAKVLGYRDAEKMTRILEDDEKGTHIMSTLGGDQELSIISESGLYAAIFKSRREEAKKFRKWVTAEVLPSIRKTGGYTAVPPAPTFAPMNHGADILASADRTFRAMLRSCRAVGLRLPQAIGRANEATLRRTGVDVLAEIDAADMVAAMSTTAAKARAAQMEDPLRPMVAEWLDAHPEVIEVRSETLVKAILANVTERQLRGAQMRVAEILRDLGWTHRKLSTGRRENLWVRPMEETYHDRDY